MRDQDLQTDYYETLGVSSDATYEEIRHAYQRLLVAWHPERTKNTDGPETVQRLNRAWEILSDSDLRAEYNEYYLPRAKERRIQDKIARRTGSFSMHAKHCRIETCFGGHCFRCGQRWDICRADTSLGRDKLQCPANECYGFKIDPGRRKFGNVIWFVSIGFMLMAAFWFLNRCGDIDRQQGSFQISSAEAQAAHITTLIIVLLCVVVAYFLLALSKWLVGGTRNSEWWRVWHHGDTSPFVLETEQTVANIST